MPHLWRSSEKLLTVVGGHSELAPRVSSVSLYLVSARAQTSPEAPAP